MRFSLATLAATTAILGSAANAQAEGTYFGMGLMGGVTDTHDIRRDPAQTTPIYTSSDSYGLSGGAAVWLGYDLKPNYRIPLRTELASSFRFRHDSNILFIQASPGTALYGAKSNVQTTDFMVSLLWDIPLGSRFKPYIGGGVGAVFIDSDTDGFTPTLASASETRWNSAWQAQAGMTYAYSTKMDIRFDYRYIDMGDISTSRLASGDRFTSNLTSHDLRIGVQWKL
jgi:opacity protein-like surface antigen